LVDTDSALDGAKSGTGALEAGIYFYLVLVMLGSGLAVAGIVFAFFLKCKKLRILMHCSWCLVSVLMIFGFVILMFLSPLSVVALEFCEIFNEIISS